MTVEDHISRILGRQPSPVKLETLVAPERQKKILSAAPTSPVTRLREVKDRLPGDFSYGEIKWTLVAHQRWKPA